MPTLTEITAAVSTFVATYDVFIAAGAVIGLSIYGVVRLVKGAR